MKVTASFDALSLQRAAAEVRTRHPSFQNACGGLGAGSAARPRPCLAVVPGRGRGADQDLRCLESRRGSGRRRTFSWRTASAAGRRPRSARRRGIGAGDSAWSGGGMDRPQWPQRGAGVRARSRVGGRRTRHPARAGRGPLRSPVWPLVGAVAVAKRAEMLDVEANLWLSGPKQVLHRFDSGRRL